jgi:hypothetical protein
MDSPLLPPPLGIIPGSADDDLVDPAMEAAWERSAMPHPRDILRRDDDEILKGRPPNPAFEKWGPELEAQIMRDLAEGKK